MISFVAKGQEIFNHARLVSDRSMPPWPVIFIVKNRIKCSNFIRHFNNGHQLISCTSPRATDFAKLNRPTLLLTHQTRKGSTKGEGQNAPTLQ